MSSPSKEVLNDAVLAADPWLAAPFDAQTIEVVQRLVRDLSAPQRLWLSGFLAGSIRTFADVDGRRAAHPRFQAENFDRNRALVAKVDTIATEKGCTPSQIALAWLLAQGDDVVAIPGTRYLERLKENLGALDVHLSPEDVTRISSAIPAGAAAGTRYPAAAMKGVYV